MAYFPQKSTCNLCNKKFTQRGIGKHIRSCLTKQPESDKEYLYILVQATYGHDYFFHLLLSPTALLKDLDTFLRDKWLECCGHLSAFAYNRWDDEIPMSRKVNTVIAEGQTIDYSYDFGSTTELDIKCIGKFKVNFEGRKKIQVLSRNTQPLITCNHCDDPSQAVEVCTQCIYDGKGALCTACAKKHGCEDGLYLLPIVNSPRVGVCGYTGE